MSEVIIKTDEEIEIIRQGGHRLGRILKELSERVKPGVKLLELDLYAEEAILKAGGRPSFKGYCARGEVPFPSSICASVNEQVVHGPANLDRTLESGDIIGMDIGMEYPATNGLFTDTAITVGVGRLNPKVKNLLKVTQESLTRGIDAIKIGNSISDISKAVEAHIKPHGYGIVRKYVGHGVGKHVHEDPRIPNFYDDTQPDISLVQGMVLAIEPMVTLGDGDVKTIEDGWTVVTADQTLAAHFEHTVAITDQGVEIITVRA